MKKPNILYIFSDQHRKFDLGCYGNLCVQTPNLDNLAKKGVRFEHCISNFPVCVPARGTMLTGLFPSKHGALMNDMAISTKCESIADVMKRSGYHTGYIGKWHLNGIPRDQAIPKECRLGFEEWKVHNCNHRYLNCYYYDEENVKHTVDGYEPVVFGDLAEKFIREKSEIDKPWMLYLSFATPHDPHLDIEEKYFKLYESKNILLRDNLKDKILFKYQDIFRLNEYFSTEEYRECVKGYYGHITAIDAQIGRLIQALKETNQYKDTVIVYTSDHGNMLGSQGMIDKQVPYEEAIAIPLIISWENHIRVGITDEIIGLNDIPITLAGLVGAKFVNKTDGIDLHRLLFDKKEKSYNSAYLSEYYPAHNWGDKRGTEWRAVRTKRYTFAITSEKDWLLFDNIEDPLQKNNLVDNPMYQEIKEMLRQELYKYVKGKEELLPGIEYIRKYGDIMEFKRSQEYFGKLPVS